MLDWIAALGAPALLVVGSYLGHAEPQPDGGGRAAAARRDAAAAIVVSESSEQPVALAETAAVSRGSCARCRSSVLPRAAHHTPESLLPLLAPFVG